MDSKNERRPEELTRAVREAGLSRNAAAVLERRYLARDRAGEVTETPEEMFQRVAQNLSQAELEYGADEERRQEVERKIHDVMSRLEFLPNSPTLMNAGRELQQLSACFVLPIEDSLDSIFNTVKQMALIHKSGGGTGFSFSRLRPTGDMVGSTGGVASGPVSFIGAFDAATDVVKQGGTRRGANMAILNVEHPDILDFIRVKREPGRLANFNISVAVTGDFMEKVKLDEEYELVNPRNGESVGRLNAKEVFDEIVESAWATGDPGLVFLDRINEGNPNPQLGRIESTNPCVTGDTVVETCAGPRQVRELVGTQFSALVNGKPHLSAPEGFFSSGVKQTIRLNFNDGRCLTLTPDHLVMEAIPHDKGLMGLQWTKAENLRTGDFVQMHNHGPSAEPRSRTAGTEIPRNKNPHFIPTVVVTHVEYRGEEEVFDVRIPMMNAFDANGLYVHNCGEQPLLPHESCNLGSINLARMLHYDGDSTGIDREKLAETIRIGVRTLDNVINMNRFPIDEIAEMSRRTRRIGLGVMGWADMLVQLRIRYDSEEALKLAGEVMKFIRDGAHDASEELAEERGVFPAWEGSVYNRPDSRTDRHRPMRNSAPVTIAPTGTISIIAGASSGIEPLFALSYVRNVMDGTRLVEVNPYFEAMARQEGFYSEELMERLTETGSLEELDVPGWVREVFRTSHEIEPRWHVLMQAAFQKHTDNSVSKTINMPAGATREDVRDAYLQAYVADCNGITVYRDGSKTEQVLSAGRTGETDQAEPGRPAPLERPRLMNGITERFRTGHGNMYVTLNFSEAGGPFEIFSNLGKAGGCDSAQLEAVSRLASLALRSGVNPAEIIYNLRGITCCPAWDDGTQIRSAPDAMAHMLNRHWRNENGERGDEGEEEADTYGRVRCPDCNAAVEFREGCEVCPSPGCGWTRCR